MLVLYAGFYGNIRTAFMAELMQRLLVCKYNVYYRWRFPTRMISQRYIHYVAPYHDANHITRNTMISTTIASIIDHNTTITDLTNIPRISPLTPRSTHKPNTPIATPHRNETPPSEKPLSKTNIKTMDTSLINLIPNLTSSLRSTTLPRSEPTNPPPPYTLAPHPSPQRSEPTLISVGVPLRIEILGAATPETNGKRPITWSGDDSIALGPYTTYGEFLDVLQRRLRDVKVSRESGRWKVGVVAEIRGRSLWLFKEQIVDVAVESWGEVLEGLGEGRFRGFRVSCWRE